MAAIIFKKNLLFVLHLKKWDDIMIQTIQIIQNKQNIQIIQRIRIINAELKYIPYIYSKTETFKRRLNNITGIGRAIRT